MTQSIITQSSYVLSLLKTFFNQTIKVLQNIAASMIEARQKQANAEVARQLMHNRDFENYSFSEIMEMLEKGKIN